jgi:hypothetical protein
MSPLQTYAAAIAELHRCRAAVIAAADAGDWEAAAIRREALEQAQTACLTARQHALRAPQGGCDGLD